MNKSRIEWTDYSWNPIKGVCPVGCWYCYAKSIYRRFKLDPKPWLDIAELNDAVHTKRTGKRVFVCSTFELFHPVADKWRDMIFDVIQRRPDLTFIILTKMPEWIDRRMPDNVWLGVSVTGGNQEAIDRLSALCDAHAKIKFASIEPLLDPPCDAFLRFLVYSGAIDWVIVGRLTGHGKKYDPVLQRLGRIRVACNKAAIPLFLKNNLAGIWPGRLIQEWPK